MQHYDTIVVGSGGIGSAAIYHLASRGKKVLALDRFPPAHDRGSSHGQTRIIRQAYFEHPDYVPLLLHAYQLWAQLEAQRGQQLFHQVGLLEAGPADGVVISGIIDSVQKHGLACDELALEEVKQRWQNAIQIPAGYKVLFEPQAGFLMVEQCILAHLELARQLGAELVTGCEVRSWQVDGNGVVVETDSANYSADRLVITAGAWSADLLHSLDIPLEVTRKPLFWFATEDSRYEQQAGFPCFFYELSEGYFYGFPKIDSQGVKVAEHSGGQPVADPLQLDRTLHPEDQVRVEGFLKNYLPGAAQELSQHAVCMYTLSQDEHFIVDRHPEHAQVVFCAGLSGHGFKFATVLGEILADLAITGSTKLPIDFLSCQRAGLRKKV